MAIESLLVMDFLMNLSILCAVQLGLGTLHPPSLCKALCVMGVNTLLGRFAAPELWRGVPVQFCVCLVCGAIIARSLRPRAVCIASLCIFCATIAAAGCAALGSGAPILAAAGLALFFLIIKKRRHKYSRWQVEIVVEKCGLRERFWALIDTGNRLTEHRSALPVLIVEANAIPTLCRLCASLSDREIRTLGFGVLGSTGEMRCFQPDRVFILSDSGALCTAPDCWIGVFNGKIPGGTQALAPPEFAEYSSFQDALQGAISDKIRRISHVILKRSTVHLRPRSANQARQRLLYRRKRASSASAEP